MSKAQKVSQTESDIDRKLSELPTVSGKIRFLHSQNWSKGAIAKKLNKRYQHVRNVLITPVANPK